MNRLWKRNLEVYLVNAWARWHYMPFVAAAKYASEQLIEARGDWAETSEWLDDFSWEAVLLMWTHKKAGQPALVPVPLYHTEHMWWPEEGRSQYRIVRISENQHPVYRLQYDGAGYISDDWHKRHDGVLVKRRELEDWLKVAKRWRYLKGATA